MHDILTAPKIPVSKLNAALRQLHTAIDLFFCKGDCIAIHTLASAAAMVLYDIARSRGVVGIIDLIRADRKMEFLKVVRASQNFFKHADRDPEAVLAFAPSESHFQIMDALMNCESLKIPLSAEREIFSIWFALYYPETIDWNAAPPWLSQLRDGLDDYLDPFDPLNLKLFSKLLLRRQSDRQA
jgi:hypothetical protein